MHGLKAILRQTLPPNASDDAETLLARLLPVAFHLVGYKSKPWPYCEAIDETGRLRFFPNVWVGNQLVQASVDELEDCLRLGLLAGTFRSVGLAELLMTDCPEGKSLNIELFLARQVSVSLTVPLRTEPDIWIGQPLVIVSPSDNRKFPLDM